MTIQLTPQESEEYFYNSLCNSLGYMGGYGVELTYNEDEYKMVRESLLKDGSRSTPCYEDVLMEMLRQGYSLTMEDIEGEGDMARTITLKDVHEKVMKTPVSHLSDMINENDDCITGDCILQTVFYDEIIFG